MINEENAQSLDGERILKRAAQMLDVGESTLDKRLKYIHQKKNKKINKKQKKNRTYHIPKKVGTPVNKWINTTHHV